MVTYYDMKSVRPRLSKLSSQTPNSSTDSSAAVLFGCRLVGVNFTNQEMKTNSSWAYQDPFQRSTSNACWAARCLLLTSAQADLHQPVYGALREYPECTTHGHRSDPHRRRPLATDSRGH